ncbi:hypothetical protein AFK24_10320 [Pseudomonas syringae]|uniref:Uncharacterized protein n=1 Tax=Pseudomonas syringae TaxID=317 RepID=A0A1C7Z545_PSESX|nr:hypothetical protein [Pseudomonas syringae]OCR25162.1 hypothetical protein AFK24_10320 [Pseudomonas syringae]
MSMGLTEEDMRRALGLDEPAKPAEQPEPVIEFDLEPTVAPEPEPEFIIAPPEAEVKPEAVRPKAKRVSPALRVTMRCTKVFEGEETMFVYDAKTLSTFDAEQEAKKAAAKEKFKYFEVISVKRVE